MANTVTRSGNVLEISAMDSDWLWSDTFTDTLKSVRGIRVESIQLSPNATDDILIVREGSITGPALMRVKAATKYDEKCKYFSGERLRPCIDYSECAVASCTVIIHLSSRQ